ncbi:GNAT family N-acetyltransferase [Chloroflexota bacterium]
MKPPEIIETKRLYLRPPTLSDSEDIFRKYAQDLGVTKYLVWKPHENLSVTREFISRCIRCWKEETAYPWAIIRKEDEELIGMIEIRIDNHLSDMGFGIERSSWGKGYVTEAARTIVDWLFNQPSIYRVWAVCDVENKASARVMEKIGMQREGILRRYIVHPNISNEPRDCLCYARVK